MDHEKKIDEVKTLHAALAQKEQEVIIFLDELKREIGAREIALVRTHLQDARHYTEDAWLELEKEGTSHYNDQKE